MLFLRKKISSLHFNERHSATFLRPRAVSCANLQNFIFFLNQLHLHFIEPSEASSLSGCERGLCRGHAGEHIWSCLREPEPSPLQHKHSDSSNVTLSASLWLLWQLISMQAVYVQVWMQRWSHRAVTLGCDRCGELELAVPCSFCMDKKALGSLFNV